MKALTLWRPWGYMIAHQKKRIENRPWKPPKSLIGERLVIHHGKRWDREDAWSMLPQFSQSAYTDASRVGLVAVARVVAVIDAGDLFGRTCMGELPADWNWQEQRKWYAGPFGWVLDEVVALEPVIACKGHQGLWNLEPHLEAKVLAQLGEAKEVNGDDANPV